MLDTSIIMTGYIIYVMKKILTQDQISVDTEVNTEYSTETIPEFGQHHTLTKRDCK